MFVLIIVVTSRMTCPKSKHVAVLDILTPFSKSICALAYKVFYLCEKRRTITHSQGAEEYPT
jgi:hypothetical protein